MLIGLHRTIRDFFQLKPLKKEFKSYLLYVAALYGLFNASITLLLISNDLFSKIALNEYILIYYLRLVINALGDLNQLRQKQEIRIKIQRNLKLLSPVFNPSFNSSSRNVYHQFLLQNHSTVFYFFLKRAELFQHATLTYQYYYYYLKALRIFLHFYFFSQMQILFLIKLL